MLLECNYTNANIAIDCDRNILYFDGMQFQTNADTNLVYINRLANRGWAINKKSLSKFGLDFSLMGGNLLAIWEIFEERVYDVDVSNKEVVDVGAGQGDSALFFALRGAKKVLAYEANTQTFETARANILRNQLGRTITIENKLVVSENLFMDITHKGKSPTDSTSRGFNTSLHRSVSNISIEEIVDRLSEPFLLKMDCEGCEYSLIMNSYDALKKFEIIIFEFHPLLTGVTCFKLKSLLERDFICKTSNREVSMRTYSPLQSPLLGVMYCYKRHI